MGGGDQPLGAGSGWHSDVPALSSIALSSASKIERPWRVHRAASSMSASRVNLRKRVRSEVKTVMMMPSRVAPSKTINRKTRD